ncbi:hypothetical protein [Streptomyces sp. NPDC127197]|uniref:hypothetical protein n=1 Tax=Streptomyces sp. NPDC127197 TaxID=3345388 RepID=UPI00362F6147
MTASARLLGSRRVRIATSIAACALALTPWAAQAQTATQAAPSGTPWKLAMPLAQAQSSDFFDVEATSRTDAWVVGRTIDESWTATPLVRHWDGTRWSDVPPVRTDGRPAQLDAVAASGPNDVWVAGTYNDALGSTTSSARIPDHLAGLVGDRLRSGAALPATASPIVLQHWNGTRWTRFTRPAPAEGWIRFVARLTSMGPDSVWLTTLDWNPATNEYAGQLEHWDGDTWRKTALPPAPDGSRVEPWAITGTGPDDVWVTARADNNGTATPLLYHFDGRRWTVKTVPTPSEADGGWVANHAVTTERGDVLVFGKPNQMGTPSSLLATRWDGHEWHPVPVPGVDEVNAAGTDGSGAVWVAGWPVGNPHTVLSRWNGTAWTEEQLPADLTSTSEGSSVFNLEGIPGTRAMLAAGNAACDSTTGACGLLASRGVR